MKKYITSVFILTLIIPSIAFASWWNPFSWDWRALFNSPVKNETQVVNPVINPVVNTDSIKDTPKSIPAVDNSTTIKSEVQAKIDAGLKAKAELDALIAKQKE